MPEAGRGQRKKPGAAVRSGRAGDPGRWSSEELQLRVAWYYYKDELTQDEIARRLSISRASVGRLLDRARRVGLVSINLNTEYLDAFELSGELRRVFGLAEALVVPDHEKEPADRRPRDRQPSGDLVLGQLVLVVVPGHPEEELLRGPPSGVVRLLRFHGFN